MGKQVPKAPDPIQTANAQTKSNIGTAVAQTNINQVDQSTPNGSITYKQVGTNADGTPHYAASQTLSPELQTAFNNATGSAATPVDLSENATEARLMQLGQQRLDPLLAKRAQDTETDLINRGIRPGSDAYGQAHTLETQGDNDAYNSLILSGHQQAVSDALAQHNGPINDYAALTGTGQQIATPQTSVAGTDVSGLTENAYAQQMQQYQQQQSDLYGGLFGLGKAALGIPGLFGPKVA